MNQEKIGQFIKDIRKNNNLTQNDFANMLGVTYQAVSKWETGKSLPDISTLQLISKTFNVNIEELLEGQKKDVKKKWFLMLIPVVLILLGLLIWGVIYYNRHHHDFEFKTISTTCKDFTINGSAAYNYDKTSIYISNINYCGKENNTVYEKIECNLYEDYGDTITLVSKCNFAKQDVTLEEYLKDVEINVDNYSAVCKKFKESSLYLEINATMKDESVTTYKIPIALKNNC
ncbi:MAG: helix-turn-helix transcriptional regulator [Bacilli bacterium]|nr:helix-turn-helix transcriptional regulator [Bacilli bacterium]